MSASGPWLTFHFGPRMSTFESKADSDGPFQCTSFCRYDAPSLAFGDVHEAARVHHAFRQYDGGKRAIASCACAEHYKGLARWCTGYNVRKVSQRRSLSERFVAARIRGRSEFDN